MPNKKTDVVNVAMWFVDLALKYKPWDGIKALPADEIQILFETVSIAGFDPKKIVHGKLVGYYLDQDSSRTGETFPINTLSPFKVVGQDNDDHYPATGWLDCALRRTVNGLKWMQKKENREELIEVIAGEIERSIPLTPIQLTLEGDLLGEYPPDKPALSRDYFVNHTRNENCLDLDSCVGVHEFCDHRMDRMRATKTHDAIVCQACNLRILFPKEVKTYGELRQALTKKVQVTI